MRNLAQVLPQTHGIILRSNIRVIEELSTYVRSKNVRAYISDIHHVATTAPHTIFDARESQLAERLVRAHEKEIKRKPCSARYGIPALRCSRLRLQRVPLLMLAACVRNT